VSMLEQPNTDLMQHFGVKAIFLLTQVNRERLTQLTHWIDQNNIKINIDKTFSLDQTAEALDYGKDVYPRGNVILEIKS
jgi:alcohol dehydrogenase